MIRTVKYVGIGPHQVFTLLSEPDQPTGKLVIMAHGFRGSSIGPARTFVNFERLLLEDGFACLRFDQPSSGNSSGVFAESSFDQWIATLIELTLRQLAAGYRVALLGQSMGATATMVAAANRSLRNRLPCILLWVPDPVATIDETVDFGEEGGQVYPTSFWQQARDAAFFPCLAAYPGAIHLVYGEDDEFVSPELRRKVIDAVSAKGEPYIVLPGQGHSSWDYDVATQVFEEERRFLAQYF